MANETKFYEHPEYTSQSPEWQKYRDLYLSDHATLCSKQYLWPHELESSQSEFAKDATTGIVTTVGQVVRNLRALRSRNLNILEPLVSNWISMLFRKPIDIDDKTRAMLGDEIDNIDGKGTSLEDFIKNQVAIAYFRDIRPVLYVDAPGADFKSKAEQQLAGFRPFAEVIDVLALKDWEFYDSGPKSGKYKWARWEFRAIEPRNGPDEEPKEVTYCIVASDAEPPLLQYYKQDSKSNWELTEEVNLSKLSELPLSTIHNADAWLKDVAELQLVLFNLLSAYYSQLNQQAFQRIFIAGNLGEKHMISISEFAVSQIPVDAQVTVVEPAAMDTLKDAIESTIDRMYRVAFNRTRGLSAASNEAPGADTIKEMNVELMALLVSAASEIESVVNSMLVHYARFKGIEDFDGKVTIDKNLSLDDVNQELEIYAMYRDEIRKNLPWRKAHLRKVVDQFDYSDKEQKEIKEQIELLKEEEPSHFGELLVAGMNGQQQADSKTEPPSQDGSRVVRGEGGAASGST